MVTPVTPAEARGLKASTFPDEVIESFNFLIAKGLDGGTSTVKQSDVEALILSTFAAAGKTYTSNEVHSNGWLDVEDAYREAGWSVKYDKPDYTETYPATFEFKAKRR